MSIDSVEIISTTYKDSLPQDSARMLSFQETVDVIAREMINGECIVEGKNIIKDISDSYFYILTNTLIRNVPGFGWFVKDKPFLTKPGFLMMHENFLAASIDSGDESVRFVDLYQNGKILQDAIKDHPLINALIPRLDDTVVDLMYCYLNFNIIDFQIMYRSMSRDRTMHVAGLLLEKDYKSFEIYTSLPLDQNGFMFLKL